MMPLWAWVYIVGLVGFYVLLASLRVMQWRREVAYDARRAQMWRELEAAGYYDVKPPKPPAPPRRRWFDDDGVEIFED